MSDKIKNAVELYNKGEYEKAIDIFSSVLETEKPTVEVYNTIGLCYNAIGNSEKAEDNFLKAIELDPKAPELYINLADIYYKNKDFGNGIELLLQGEYEIPDNMVIRHFLARFYMEDSRLDLAIDELEKVLEVQPENYDAYYDLGKVHFELGNYAPAIENFENVLEYKEDNQWIYFYLAQAYEANDEIDKAISNYLKTIARDDGFYQAYKKVAILFLARGDYEDAVEYFEDYMDMGIPEEEKNNIAKLVERIKKKSENEK